MNASTAMMMGRTFHPFGIEGMLCTSQRFTGSSPTWMHGHRRQ